MIHFGIIEDIQDPKELGRVRVRVYGVHTHSTTLIPTEDLPWASVMQPTTSAANSGVGETPRLLQNSLVLLMFLDDSFQSPIVLGSVASDIVTHIITLDDTKIKRGTSDFGFQDPDGVYPTSIYETDMPKLAQTVANEFQRTQHNSSNALFTITEPEDIRDKHEYPHNQVKQSASGHYEEWDDTKQNERLNRQHKSGTFEEIRPDGTIVRKIVADGYTITANNQNIFVDGNVNLHINQNCNTYIKGDWNINVDGNVNTNIKGNHSETITGNHSETISGSQNSTVSGSVSEDYSAQTTKASGQITIDSARLDLNP